MDRPRTRKALWGFIDYQFGVKLPWKTYTSGHSSPFAFIADAYFGGSAMAAWANRSGGKTLAASIIAGIDYLMARTPIKSRVLSGSADQARNLYEYWQRWCYGPLRGLLVGDPLRSLTRISGGEFSILTASQSSVRGPKVQRLFRDEIDEIDPELWEASGGMMASTPGIPAATFDLSTWHRVDGPMARLVDNAEAKGIALYKWNVWETITTCPPDRHMQGKGCDGCDFAPACRGKAREVHGPDHQVGIAAEAVNGIAVLDDVIKFQWRQWDRATWDAEAECKRPSPVGLVYAEFDADTSRVTELPLELEVCRAIDFGWVTFACLWLGYDKRNDTVYVLDSYESPQGTVRQHADYLNRHARKQIAATYVDPAGRNKSDQTGKSAVDELRAAGIVCRYTLAPRWREVANGVQLVRKYIAPAAGPARLRWLDTDNNRRGFVRAMQSYRNRKVNDIYIDDPAKPQEADHLMDALRYFFVNRLAPSSGVTVGTAGAQ